MRDPHELRPGVRPPRYALFNQGPFVEAANALACPQVDSATRLRQWIPDRLRFAPLASSDYPHMMGLRQF
jgi:hypothetical protein